MKNGYFKEFETTTYINNKFKHENVFMKKEDVNSKFSFNKTLTSAVEARNSVRVSVCDDYSNVLLLTNGNFV